MVALKKRRRYWVLPAIAGLIAVLFLVVPAVHRLWFFAAGRPAVDRADAAFIEYPVTGLLHVAPGLLMVVLAPLQLSASIRRRWPIVHRWAGRVFALTGVTVAVTGIAMNTIFPPAGGTLKVVVIYAMGTAQIVALILAVRAILRRDVRAHRAWMMRVLGVTLSAGAAGVVVAPVYLVYGTASDLVIGVGRCLGFLVSVAIVEVVVLRSLKLKEGV